MTARTEGHQYTDCLNTNLTLLSTLSLLEATYGNVGQTLGNDEGKSSGECLNIFCFQCRKAQSSGSWGDLPLDVLLLIIHQMHKHTNHFVEDTMLQMWGVSRAWRAAVEAYSGSSSLHEDRLPLYCRIFPGLSGLHVDQGWLDDIDLSPLQSCAKLTHLSFQNDESPLSSLDAGNIPPSVKHLILNGYVIDPPDLEDFTCPGLINLEWEHWATPADFDLLFPKVPKLQVRHPKLTSDCCAKDHACENSRFTSHNCTPVQTSVLQ